MRLRTVLSFLMPVLSATAALGCADVLGLSAYDTSSSGGVGASGGTAGSGGTAASGGTGGTGGTSSDGGGGTGGTTSSGGAGGTGGASTTTLTTECEPDTTGPCYDGPPGTEGIGECKPGTRTCDATGTWGACTGGTLPAAELCTADADENCDQISTCAGQYRWAHVAQGAGAQNAGGIAADRNDGSLVVVGANAGTVDFGGTPLASTGAADVFVAKFSATGKHLWSLPFGESTGAQSATGVAVDAAGNIVVVGRFEQSIDFGGATQPLDAKSTEHDAFVVKLDPDGVAIWSTSIGDASGSVDVNAVALDASGDVYVTGAYTAALTVGAGPPLPAADGADNILVARLDGTTGAPGWSKGYGGPQAQTGRAIAVGKGGAIFVAADAAGPLDFGNGLLGEGGGGDVAVAMLAPADGSTTLAARYGDAAQQLVAGIAPAYDSGVVVLAQVRGNVTVGQHMTVGDASPDALVFKLTANNTVPWAVRAGAAATGQIPHGLAIERDTGNIVIAGLVAGSIDFSNGTGGLLTATTPTDRFLVKLGPDGSYLWGHLYPNAQDQPTLVTVDALSRIGFAAELVGETIFGDGPVSSFAGTRDVVIGQLAP